MADEAYQEQHKYIRWILLSMLLALLISYLVALAILPIESWVRKGIDGEILNKSLAFWAAAIKNPKILFLGYMRWWHDFHTMSYVPFSYYLPFLPIVFFIGCFIAGIAINPYQYMPNIFGSGRLASVSDVKKMKLFKGFVCVLGKFHGKLLKMPETLSALVVAPPGTGKTLLAKALATQGKTTFFNVSPTTFASKWKGESEKLVRILFEMARFYAPTTIFIDEVDSLCSKRGEGNEGEGSRRVKAELLVQMEGVNSNTSASANEKSEEDKRKIVTVMAATNRPWDLDDALRRRFEKRVYIPLPNEKGRLQLFNLNLKKIEVDKNINYDRLVELTNGYSGADICNVCREASFMPMRRELLTNSGRKIEELVNDQDFRTKIRAPIVMNDFEKAISNISKSVSQKDLEVYDKWTKEFSSV